MHPTIRSTLVAASVAFFGNSAGVHAQQTPFYVGASAGSSQLDFDFTGQVRTLSTGFLPVTRASLTDKKDTAFKITGGYQALPWLAFELDYVNLGEFATNYEFSGLGRYTRRGRYELDGWNLSAVFIQQVDEKVSVNARVGLFRSLYKYSETGENFPAFQPSPEPPIHSFRAPDLKGNELSYGLGAGYRLNNNVSLRLNWDRYTKIGNTIADNETSNGKFDNVDLFSLGVVYRF